jgi:flotillin
MTTFMVIGVAGLVLLLVSLVLGDVVDGALDAREVAAPISAIDQLTVISSDGAGALPRQVNDNVVQTLTMLKTSTGLDLEALIKKSVGRAAGTSNGDGPHDALADAPRA